MPFTFSHPLVVLPFRKWSGKWFSMTALAIGSMAPDVEFFLRMRAQTLISHTWAGIFLFNIPVVVLVAFLYHGWVRDPFLDHLPEFLRRRFLRYKHVNWAGYFRRNWGKVLCSAFIGVLTHLLLDHFTHAYGWFARHLPPLADSYTIFGKSFAGYHLLQYISSLVLGLLLVVAALRMPPAQNTLEPKPVLAYWSLVAITAVLIFCLRFYLGTSPFTFSTCIMTAVVSGLLGILSASSAAHLRSS